MNDMELANKVNDLGADVAIEGSLTPDEFYHRLVRDWRVAGALMERLEDGELTIWKQKYEDFDSVWIVETHLTRADGTSNSLPRAIVEACVTALEQS